MFKDLGYSVLYLVGSQSFRTSKKCLQGCLRLLKLPLVQIIIADICFDGCLDGCLPAMVYSKCFLQITALKKIADLLCKYILQFFRRLCADLIDKALCILPRSTVRTIVLPSADTARHQHPCGHCRYY